MTPEEAREHLAWPEGKDHPKVRDGDGRTWFEVQAGESHPYWNRLPDAPYEDAVMYAVAQGALATLAGMRPEYREEEWQGHYPGWVPTSPWTAEKPVGGPDPNTRVVRRYVTETEEIS